MKIDSSDDPPGRFGERLAELDPAALAALPDDLFGDALDDATLTEFEMDGAREAWELDGGPLADMTTLILA